MLTVGSLFSGIGGFDLGLERTGGFKTIWQCEIDPFCNKILEKHWPTVTRYTDVRTMSNIPLVDVICASPPCQPVSCAGKRKGAKDDRWMWGETYRIICEVRPEWVIVENVLGLLSAKDTEGKPGGLFTGILRDFSKSGYDVEWNVVSAAFVGAPHLRKRVFVVAHSTSQQNDSQHIEPGRFGEQFGRALEGGREALRQENGQAGYNMLGGCCEDVAHALGLYPQRRGEAGNVACQSREAERKRGPTADRTTFSGLGIFADGLSEGLADAWRPGWEDGTPRLAIGQKDRVNRLKALGNAIVPQCSELVGYYILELTRK